MDLARTATYIDRMRVDGSGKGEGSVWRYMIVSQQHINSGQTLSDLIHIQLHRQETDELCKSVLTLKRTTHTSHTYTLLSHKTQQMPAYGSISQENNNIVSFS